jgi:hypothetical protein
MLFRHLERAMVPLYLTSTAAAMSFHINPDGVTAKISSFAGRSLPGNMTRDETASLTLIDFRCG